ncbi:hypothetical protein QBC32DRAFT_208170, partial [Pseudoneurospora amorphoporcata]
TLGGSRGRNRSDGMVESICPSLSVLKTIPRFAAKPPTTWCRTRRGAPDVSAYLYLPKTSICPKLRRTHPRGSSEVYGMLYSPMAQSPTYSSDGVHEITKRQSDSRVSDR